MEFGSFSEDFNGFCTIHNGMPKCISNEKHAEMWLANIIVVIFAYLIYYRCTS
jgi:hypothetical protein